MSGDAPTAAGLAPILLQDGLILGRGAEANGLLPDSAVSRRHLVDSHMMSYRQILVWANMCGRVMMATTGNDLTTGVT